jgi:Domain of unknown function (DUF3883)
MRRKSRHILTYWRPQLVADIFDSKETLDEMAPVGGTIVRPGDVEWICTRLRRSGTFLLLGRMVVGECLREGSRRTLLAKKGTTESFRAVSLMKVYGDIRFNTKNYNDRLILRHGRINPEQLGSPRILTDQSIGLLNTVWYDGQDIEEFAAVLEEDIIYAAEEAGYADPITNKEVENEAVSLVTKWYEERGWNVDNVETEKRGYDLLCYKGRLEEHVEVKGTQGAVPSYFITANEYECAKEDPLFILCVVTEIFSQQPYIYSYATAHIFDDFEFTIQQYKAMPRNF